ncbi:uncharacterized protein LOC133778212 [Humulus lupulus]|uniref:uncharacterized protein LOC133778212 n=1 Tax=Humulus lupulus TaxID=3486 RepID=UPI002B41750E|nr:uncharacterized protein LOC133778212 [Humulus lupulus]
MLIRRDFDLNSVDMCTDSPHVYTDSLVEVFRDTMLKQEIIFRNQVHELHRIYRMQKTLMQNKIQQRPLGHHGLLHSKQYISSVDSADLKLSLRVKEDIGKHKSGKNTWFDVNIHPYAENFIDLEESSATTSNEDSGNAPPSSVTMTDPIITSSLKKDQSHETVENSSFLDNQEKSSFDQGLKECDSSNVLNRKPSTKMEQISTYGKWEVDLNKICCDDSSCYSNDPMLTHPSTASSSHTSIGLVGTVEEGNSHSKVCPKECNNCSDETSGITHPDDSGNFALVDLNSSSERTEICAKHLKVHELSGSEVVLGPCEEFGCNKNDSDDVNIKNMLEISKNQTNTCIATIAVNHEKGKSENDFFTCSDHSKDVIQDGHGNTSSAPCKPCHIGDNESSNAETTQSEVEFLNPLPTDRLLENKKPRPSDSSELTHECLLSEEESDEVDVDVDVSIRKAAESLIHFSLESSAVYEHCSMKDAESIDMEANERAIPQSSYDSFELFTLKLKECSEDDFCVSSKPSEVNFSETKDYGFKIRRGRRLKDFQRDILPGMASLSRHEICEDINILEGVLRSREYRKNQAKMGDGHSWCTPARSRRSRLNYTGRRRFS